MAGKRKLPVRLVETKTNGFTGRTWRTYQDSHGHRAAVCIRPYLARRRKTDAQCRAEAVREIEENYHRRGRY